MIASLYAYINNRFPDSDLLRHVLQNAVKTLQYEFSSFGDCGAGVGYTAMLYLSILHNNLEVNAYERASIVCYEPLPENCLELSKRISQHHAAKRVTLREMAVSDFNGSSSFSIPKRMIGGASAWSEGASAVGYLGNGMGMAGDSIPVQTVRLEDEPFRFDFIKMDLQGGEKAALAGLGGTLDEVKVLYI